MFRPSAPSSRPADIAPVPPLADASRHASGAAGRGGFRWLRTASALGAIVVAVTVGGLFWWLAKAGGSPTSDGGLTVSSPAVSVTDRVDVSVLVEAESDATLRGWFFLAEPGAPEPWNSFDYKSAVIEQDVSVGDKVKFTWSEPLLLPDGNYQITVWFHRSEGDEWVHATGGAFGIATTELRNRAPVLQQRFGGAVADVAVPEISFKEPRLSARIHLTPAEGTKEAVLSWELKPAGQRDAEALYAGPVQTITFLGGAAANASIAEDLALPAGRYDLWVTVMDADHSERQPQVARIADAVTVRQDPLFYRSVAASGPFVWRPSDFTQRVRVSAADEYTLPLAAVATSDSPLVCEVTWQLFGPTGIALGRGEGGSCAAPAVIFPPGLTGDSHVLELTARARSGEAVLISDAVRVPVEIAP